MGKNELLVRTNTSYELSKEKKRMTLHDSRFPYMTPPVPMKKHGINGIVSKNGNTAPPPPSPYQVLSRVLDFETPDQEKWWHNTAEKLSKALIDSGYDVHRQYQYLSFYYRHVLPALGLFPTKENGIHWKSILTRSGLPFEFSLNYQKSKSLVPFGFEPISYQAGSDRDPFNKKATREVLSSLAKVGIGVESDLYNHYANELVISEKESRLIREKYGSKGLFKTQVTLAVDLQKSGEIAVKAYFYPQLKALVKGISCDRLVFNAIRKTDADNRFAEPIGVMEDYIYSRNCKDMSKGVPPSFSLLFSSCDFVDPSESRIKLYMSELEATWAMVEDVWTLGGRLCDSITLEGLQMVKRLWQLFKIPEGRRSELNGFHDLSGPPPTSGHLPLIFNFELQPGRPYPIPKFYFSLFGENDMHIAEALEQFFAEIGRDDLAQTYKRNLCSC